MTATQRMDPVCRPSYGTAARRGRKATEQPASIADWNRSGSTRRRRGRTRGSFASFCESFRRGFTCSAQTGARSNRRHFGPDSLVNGATKTQGATAKPYRLPTWVPFR